MKATTTFVNYSNEGIVQIKGFDEKNLERPINLEIKHDSSNCKLSYIHYLGNIQYFTIDQKKIIIDAALRLCKGCVILNTISKTESESDFIKENYDVYYYHKVPIGYYNGYQYHIAIRNSNNINSSCRKPEENTDLLIKEQPLKNDFKTFIKEKLLLILKSKRRKSDFVDEFLNTL